MTRLLFAMLITLTLSSPAFAAAPPDNAADQVEVIRFESDSVTIPIPRGERKSAVPAPIDAGEQGIISTYFQYIVIIDADKKLLMTTRNISSRPDFLDGDITPEEFSQIKEDTRAGLGLTREELQELYRKEINQTGVFGETGEFDDGSDYLALYTSVKIQIKDRDLYQYVANVLMLIKGKVLNLSYIVACSDLDSQYADMARREVLAWHERIRAANK